MINEVMQPEMPLILSEAVHNSYKKIKALILKIFSLLKRQEKVENANRQEFFESYVDFAKKLDNEGYNQESNIYMSISLMYYDLMDRPEELISHESFFMDLYDAFEELLFAKINNPQDYESKYNEFLVYYSEMQGYYYTHVAVQSEYYDDEVLELLIGKLSGGH